MNLRIPLFLLSLPLLGAGSARGARVAPITDFSETVDGVQLYWQKAYYEDVVGGGLGRIPFGMNLPAGYTPGAGAKYPLIIFLHGAGTRSDWSYTDPNPDYRDHSLVDPVMRLPSARFFAKHSQTDPAHRAFVITPNISMGNGEWVYVRAEDGPYVQGPGTYTPFLYLVERLMHYLTDPANDDAVLAALGARAGDIDPDRIYVVGESIGGYGVWDLLGRQPYRIAAAIPVGGSGPKNRLDEIRTASVWAVHGADDNEVPNYLPYGGDPDGGGSLGMLGLIDPSFDGIHSTRLVYVDSPLSGTDNPDPADVLVYSQFPGGYDHATVTLHWTGLTSGILPWLFGQSIPEPPPIQRLVATGDAFHLEWAYPGPYRLEFSPSFDFADPVLVDVTGLTAYEYVTHERHGFFRLIR